MRQPSGAGNCRLLFVYGTLRRGFELHHHLTRLGARFQVEARVAAKLVDLGRYPGALPATGNGEWVHGELFELGQPQPDLQVLDRVEGFIPSAPERSEFIRSTAEVILANGARECAWIYWLAPRAAAGRGRIAGGDYAVRRGREVRKAL
jgi:gamma-glutamylcyclotransferase (GGCT)/AIG2-like uncharacterized protein YtfP